LESSMTALPTTMQTPALQDAGAPSGGWWTVISIVASIAAVVVSLGLILWIALAVPRFEEIFRDFGVKLPVSVRATFTLASWLNGRNVGQVIPGWLLLLPVTLAAFFGCVVLGRHRSVRSLAAIILVLYSLVVFLFLLLSATGVFVALTAMIESMQGGKL